MKRPICSKAEAENSRPKIIVEFVLLLIHRSQFDRLASHVYLAISDN